LIAFEGTLQFEQRVAFFLARVTLQSRFNEFKIHENQIGAALRGDENGIGIHQLILPNQVHLHVSFLIRFDQFIDLIQTRIFDVVPSRIDPGYAKQADFHIEADFSAEL
jgi:hypothetical protein